MPALGMAQDTGTLIRWLKNEGDSVTKGEALMEIETDKATVEVEANASGTLANVTAAPGDVVPVAQVIALILEPGETAPAPLVSAAAKPSAVAASPVARRIAEEHQIDLRQVTPADGARISKADVLSYVQTPQAAESPASLNGRMIPASPKARRLAAEQGLDLRSLNGSGPGGAVISADVELAVRLPSVTETVPVELRSALAVSSAWRVMAERSAPVGRPCHISICCAKWTPRG